MSRGRDRLEASSTLCHAHHLCVHVVTDTPPRDRYLLHSLGPVCLFGRTPSCGVVIRVSDLVHSVTPPHPCVLHASSSTCGGTHNTQGQIRCPILPNALCFVAFMASVHVHGQDWTFKCPCPLRRRLASMSTRDMEWPTHCTFPHRTSRRSCLCLGGRLAQQPLPTTTHPPPVDKTLGPDRMFISFDSHPYGAKHRFHRVRMIAPVCPTCTRCGHGCAIISGTHLASLLHG